MAKKSAGGIKKGGTMKAGASKISGKAKVAKGIVMSPAVMK